MKYPCVVETRVTYDHGGQTGMYCDYPLGLFSNVLYKGQRFEIVRGQWPITIELDWHSGPGWACVTDVTGQPLTKFRPPEVVEPDYRVYKFWVNGKRFILEFRFDSMHDA